MKKILTDWAYEQLMSPNFKLIFNCIPKDTYANTNPLINYDRYIIWGINHPENTISFRATYDLYDSDVAVHCGGVLITDPTGLTWNELFVTQGAKTTFTRNETDTIINYLLDNKPDLDHSEEWLTRIRKLTRGNITG